jgi:hypothetical protein
MEHTDRDESEEVDQEEIFASVPASLSKPARLLLGFSFYSVSQDFHSQRSSTSIQYPCTTALAKTASTSDWTWVPKSMS